MEENRKNKTIKILVKLIFAILLVVLFAWLLSIFLKSIFKKVTRFTYLKGIKDPGEMSKELFDIMYKKTMTKYAQDRRKQ